MAFMKRQQFPFYMSHMPALSVPDIRLVMKGRKLRVRLVHNMALFISDIDMVVQGKHLCCGEEGKRGLSEHLNIFHICLFSGFAEAMIPGKNTHGQVPP